MAIALRSNGSRDLSDPNITPMIDVLLVLLVIFIMAATQVRKTLDVQLPRTDGNESAASIVLNVKEGGGFDINGEAVPVNGLSARLAAIYQHRPQKIIFVKADSDVSYGNVIAAMDVARGAGVKVIGAVIPGQEGLK